MGKKRGKGARVVAIGGEGYGVGRRPRARVRHHAT